MSINGNRGRTKLHHPTFDIIIHPQRLRQPDMQHNLQIPYFHPPKERFLGVTTCDQGKTMMQF